MIAVHGNIEKYNSITKEKQSQGEPCTYDWTLRELHQLAFEIESVIRLLVSHQQTIESAIYDAETKESVIAVSIEI